MSIAMKREPTKIGDRFGKWLVVGVEPSRREGARTTQWWRCRCDCGTLRVVRQSSLRNGRSSCCGCVWHLKHGHAAVETAKRSRTYSIWASMLQRCRSSYATNFAYYGGRGIKVCDRWSDFRNFLADMGECPKGLTIDRIDVDGNYEPGNCRWSTQAEQNRNKRPQKNSIMVVYRGEEMALSIAARLSGLNKDTVYSRIRRGEAGEALFRPTEGAFGLG